MKGHHTPNIWQGKISLKTRQNRRILPVWGLSVRDEAVRTLFGVCLQAVMTNERNGLTTGALEHI